MRAHVTCLVAISLACSALAGCGMLSASGSSGGYNRAASRGGAPENIAAETGAENATVERPGLGTAWGETRRSPVHQVAFERADEERPFSVSTIFYNDRAGVDAMAAHDVRAAAHFDAPVAMAGGLTVSIIDESGTPLDAMSVGGRLYVVGEAGRRYSVVVSNRTDRRYEAVISVDGLDVCDGEAARLDKRGYLIAPRGTLTIDGFRRSLAEVAAFRFGSVAASYAARSGSDHEVGVIGLAFFGERGAAAPDGEWTDNEIEERQHALPFAGGRFAAPPQ